MPTATKDLILNLESPHNPWPLVHPLPSLVPNPTKRPARANPKKEVWSDISSLAPKGVNPLKVE